MGSSFSTTEYREQILKFSKDYLSNDDNQSLSNFILHSDDFYNVFTTCTLEDFRKMKIEKADNLIYLMSYVWKKHNLKRTFALLPISYH